MPVADPPVFDPATVRVYGDDSFCLVLRQKLGFDLCSPTVGFVAGHGWAVVEFNAAWGAGLNGCNAAKVLPAILLASGKKP